MLEFLRWYFFITFLGWLSLPIAFHFLPKLRDRGFSLSKALGLILWGFIFWLLASFNLLQNNLGGILIALAGVAILSIILARKNWDALITWIKSNVPLIVAIELLFLVLFALWAIVRAANPNIEGTEKPMELAFINAILRSPSIPPNDPWLSGYAISYYYFGYLMIAMLTRVTGIISGVAFNLTASLWFALTGIGAFGILYNLLSSINFSNLQLKANSKENTGNVGWSLLGPVFVLIISNAEGFLEYLHARGIFWSRATDGSWQSSFWKWLDILELNTPPAEPLSWIPNRPSGILFWRASRVISDYDLAGNWKEVIDEFPFFSYILADLHPHVLAMPFVLLAIAFGFNFFLTAEHGNRKGFAWKEWIKLPDFWLMALIFGGLGFLNTWDFPIYVALICLAYTLQRYKSSGWSIQRIWDFIGFGLLLGILGILMYLPFFTGFSSQAGGFMPSMNYFTRGIHFWVMFAPLLVPILIFSGWLSRGSAKATSLKNGLILSLICVFGLWLLSYLLGWIIGMFPILGSALSGDGASFSSRLGERLISLSNSYFSVHGNVGLGHLLGGSFLQRFKYPGTWLTLGVILTLIWGLISASRNSGKSSVISPESRISQTGFQFTILLILLGCGLTLIPEFIYLIDQFGWRMNTIFKFYFQAWIVWALAAAFGFAVLLKSVKKPGKIVMGLIFFAVIVIGLAYPSFVLPATTNLFKPANWTLDGSAFYAQYEPEEAAAIEWLHHAPYGYVVEAVGGQYSGYARVSKFSGLPAVLGWPGHESQWRGGYVEMGTRESDIELLYMSNNWEDALSVIQKYDIRYVYIGSLERSSMRVSENKFYENLPIVFENNSAVIFEIPEELQ
jgi:YYY domain-containing protein